MENTYWRTLGAIIAKKAGKAVTLGYITLATYEFLINLDKNMKNEPAYQEMLKHKSEFEKWSSTISCIGREPYVKESLGSVHEGGCINALSKKETLNLRYDPNFKPNIIPPDPKLAKELLGRAIDYVTQVENLADDEHFDEQKENLVKKLKVLNKKIKSPYQPNINYSPVQQELSEIVRSIIPMETVYMLRVFEYQIKLQATKPRNAAWAAASALTAGLVKKKPNKK